MLWQNLLDATEKFEVWTDYKNLKYFRELYKLNSKQHRSHYNPDQRKERLDKEISQDNSRTRNYGRLKTPTSEYCQASKYNEQSTSRYWNYFITSK